MLRLASVVVPLSNGFRALAARERVHALVDPGSWREVHGSRSSPHLARWRIEPQVDDGVVVGRGLVDGEAVILVAQDGTFLGGSIGAGHGAAIADACRLALEARAALVLLLESGGVRLHEANVAEIALARALSALFDARAAGVRTIGVVAGSCYGGASILACACATLLMPAKSRLGLSGPKVIETARGRAELDAGDEALVESIVGADVRARQGAARRVGGRADEVRAAIVGCLREPVHAFDLPALASAVGRLTSGLAEEHRDWRPAPHTAPDWIRRGEPVDEAGWLWRVPGVGGTVLRPFAPEPMGPAAIASADRALVRWLEKAADTIDSSTLVVVEDSPGHELSRRAETLCLSRYLATHARAINAVRQAGRRVVGVVAGLAHSAAFFVNALQAPTLYVVRGARLEVMGRAALARISKLPVAEVERLVAIDPILGESARHLLTLGAAAAELERADVPDIAAVLR